MSTLFDAAIREFEPADSDFVSFGDDTDDGYEPVPVETIGEFCVRRGETHPERDDWTAVPLHEADTAELTGEYIAYVDHEARGRIFLSREEDGDLTDVEVHRADEFAETRAARRIRFWHSDYTPDDYPDYYDYPVDEKETPRATVGRDALVGGMRRYIEEEKNTEKREVRDAVEEVLEDEPETYLGLTSVGDAGRDVFKFSFELPDGFDGNGFEYVVGEYDLFPDHLALLAHPDGKNVPDDMPLEVSVEDVKGSKIFLRIEDNTEGYARLSRHLSKKRRGFRLAPLLNPTPYRRETNAVEAVADDEEKLSILAGEKSLTFDDPRASSETYDDELNQEQETAVKLALLSDDLFCLHGPPGTGKTRALVEVVRNAAKSGQRVLVCADSNQAADNLLAGSSSVGEVDEDSLHAYGQHGSDEFTVRRLNADRSSKDVVRRDYSGEAAGADVVVSTNNSAAKLPSDFDIAVIDEATQSTVTSSCIPISKADRFVLAGDHRQLPPYRASEGPTGSRYGKSLFEHLYAEDGVYEGVGIQLKTQYRMHRDIMYFPNRRFYGRSLRCGREVKAVEGFEAVMGYDLGGRVYEGERCSKYNPTEVRMVSVLLDRLAAAGVADDEIAVLTPYDAQKHKILDAVGGAHADVSVDTIDSFQGGEREAVIISMVRSNPRGAVGFLGRPEDGPRRLNVAVTRAKRFCGIVADWDTLTTDADGKCTELYRDLRSYLVDTGRMQDVDSDLLRAKTDELDI